MKLRSRKNHIRVSDEGRPPKSRLTRLNLSRHVYFLFLILAIGMIAYFLFRKSYYVEGVGLITFHPIDIRAESDMKLDRLFVREGDFIDRNAPLFAARSIDDKAGGGVATIAMPEGEAVSAMRPDELSLRQKIARAQQDIQLKKAEIDYLNGTFKLASDEARRLERMISLELTTSEDLVKVARDMAEIRVKVKAANVEIGILARYQAELEKALGLQQAFAARRAAIGAAAGAGGGGPRFFRIESPIKSQVVKVMVNENEIALKGESVIKLASLDKMVIKGYFEQSRLPYLELGAMARIQFPDGSVSHGVIERFYYSTMPLPEEFQQKYEPIRRDVIVDVRPVAGEEKKWLTYHKLSVKLTVHRFPGIRIPL